MTGSAPNLGIEDLGFIQAALSAEWALSVLIVIVLTLTTVSKTVIHQGLRERSSLPERVTWDGRHHFRWEVQTYFKLQEGTDHEAGGW